METTLSLRGTKFKIFESKETILSLLERLGMKKARYHRSGKFWRLEVTDELLIRLEQEKSGALPYQLAYDAGVLDEEFWLMTEGELFNSETIEKSKVYYGIQ